MQHNINNPISEQPNKNEATNQNKIKDIYESIMEDMYKMKNKYSNNPYVQITGFDINIGIMIPSVTVSLEFKK